MENVEKVWLDLEKSEKQLKSKFWELGILKGKVKQSFNCQHVSIAAPLTSIETNTPREDPQRRDDSIPIQLTTDISDRKVKCYVHTGHVSPIQEHVNTGSWMGF